MRRLYMISCGTDRPAAEALARFAKLRGYTIRFPAIEGHYPPALPGEVTIALWSRDMMMSAGQIQFINRAIDAWSEGTLVLVRLDHTFAPRGLSDVAAIDLSFEAAREHNFQKVIDAVVSAYLRPLDWSPDESGFPDIRGHNGTGDEVGSSAANKDSRRSGPDDVKSKSKRSWPAIFGRRQSDSPKTVGKVDEPIVPVQTETESPAGPIPAQGGSPDNSIGSPPVVFVSYARANSDVVYPLVAIVESIGRKVWIDRDGIQAGDNWATLIVRAIRSADTFCLMCSEDAFKSDNVRREIYLADKYKRAMLPVRLDSSEPPEDFEYFLIDRQWLDLSGLAPGDQSRRLQQMFRQSPG